jgi:hypothetical protein
MSTIRATTNGIVTTADTTGELILTSDNGAVNISNNTGGLIIPSGTTAQRPATPTAGMIRYNTTTNGLETYTNAWISVAGGALEITSVTPVTYNGDSGTQFTIIGNGFTNDAIVKFISNNNTEYTAALTTVLNSKTIVATTPQDFTVAQEPLDIKVTQSSGNVTATDVIDCGGVPVWTTASGNLATIYDAGGNYNPIATVIATDPDTNSNITYSVTSGSLPTGTSLNTNTGQITGDPTDVATQTTSNFTISATDNAGNTSSRAFNIIVNPTLDGSTELKANTSAAALISLGITTNGVYWIKPTGQSTARQVYCDLSGGGWMLAAKINSSDSSWYWNNAYWTNTTTFSESNCNSLTTGQSGKHYFWNEFTATSLKLDHLSARSTKYVDITIPGGSRSLYTMFNAGSNQSATILAGNITTFTALESAFQGNADATNAFTNTVFINRDTNYDFGNCCSAGAGARIGTTTASVTWGGGAFNTGSKGVGAYWYYRDEHNNSCCNYTLQGPFYNSSSETLGIWVK